MYMYRHILVIVTAIHPLELPAGFVPSLHRDTLPLVPDTRGHGSVIASTALDTHVQYVHQDTLSRYRCTCVHLQVHVQYFSTSCIHKMFWDGYSQHSLYTNVQYMYMYIYRYMYMYVYKINIIILCLYMCIVMSSS